MNDSQYQYLLYIIALAIMIVLIYGIWMARRYLRKMKAVVSLPYFIFDQLILEPLVFLARWTPGGYGYLIRQLLYKVLLKKLGKKDTFIEILKITTA